MTYNHDKAKVTCPDCEREVERLREELRYAREQLHALRQVIEMAAEIWNDACEG